MGKGLKITGRIIIIKTIFKNIKGHEKVIHLYTKTILNVCQNDNLFLSYNYVRVYLLLSHLIQLFLSYFKIKRITVCFKTNKKFLIN